MEPIHLPAGHRFTRIQKETAKQGHLYVLEVMIGGVLPWVGQSISSLCVAMGYKNAGAGLYRCLRGESSRKTACRVRPHSFRLDQLDEINALIAAGCMVVASQPERWYIENAPAEPV
jgi:hypothetical protein